MFLSVFTQHWRGRCLLIRILGVFCVVELFLLFLYTTDWVFLSRARHHPEYKTTASEADELVASHDTEHVTYPHDIYSSMKAGYAPHVYTYLIVKKYPHDPHAFTQGLLFHSSDTLYESTGAVGGPSTVREVSLLSGEIRKQTQVPGNFFAEGLTKLGSKLLMMTWQTNRGFYYEATSLQPIGEFITPLSDGWGITTFEDSLVVSDATTELHFMQVGSSTEEMTLNRSVTIKDGQRPIRFANELETVGGEIWANILERDCVARIDPFTGVVNGWIDLSGLSKKLDSSPQRPGVLNGIAYDRQGDRLFFTGKNWPNVFELRIIPHKTKSLSDVRSTCHPAFSLPHYGYP